MEHLSSGQQLNPSDLVQLIKDVQEELHRTKEENDRAKGGKDDGGDVQEELLMAKRESILLYLELQALIQVLILKLALHFNPAKTYKIGDVYLIMDDINKLGGMLHCSYHANLVSLFVASLTMEQTQSME